MIDSQFIKNTETKSTEASTDIVPNLDIQQFCDSN